MKQRLPHSVAVQHEARQNSSGHGQAAHISLQRACAALATLCQPAFAAPSARFGEAAERLRQERGCPYATHGFAQGGVSRLERVVPITLAVSWQGRAGQGTFFQQVQLGTDVLAQRPGILCRQVVLRTTVVDAFVEDREVRGVLKVIAQRFQRPNGHIPVGVALGELRVIVEHEPLRPVARVEILRCIDAHEDIAHQPRAIEREEHLHRTLADIAHPPGGTAELFQTVGRSVVHPGIVHEPGQHGVERCGVIILRDGQRKGRPISHRGFLARRTFTRLVGRVERDTERKGGMRSRPDPRHQKWRVLACQVERQQPRSARLRPVGVSAQTSVKMWPFVSGDPRMGHGFGAIAGHRHVLRGHRFVEAEDGLGRD